MSKKIEVHGFKAFDADLVCCGGTTPFQYAIGETYRTTNIKLCRRGFHFCDDLLSTLRYYNLAASRFARVTALGKVITGGDKSVTTKLRVDSELSAQQFIEECVAQLLKQTPAEHVGTTPVRLDSDGQKLWCCQGLVTGTGKDVILDCRGHGMVSLLGPNSTIINRDGVDSILHTSGSRSTILSCGIYTQISNAGDYSTIVSTGTAPRISDSGYNSRIIIKNKGLVDSSGYDTMVLALGDNTVVNTSGESNTIRCDGKYNTITAIGDGSKVRAGFGSTITLAHSSGLGSTLRTGKIDGKHLKPDTWYTLDNLKFVPVKP